MRGNSLRFFKPPVFIKTFLVFCAIFAAQLFSSCKQLASFDPGVDGARVAVNKTFAAPTGVTATQGRKRIISLEWTPVSGARYYDIYCAKSATAEFAKVGETNKNSFDDKVGAGSTMYYKVCAVKSNGTQSAFSTIVKGTSLAQPVISGIVDDKDDFSVTISWFMENACGVDGRSNYEDELKFEVFCEPKNGGSENNSQSKVVEAKKKPSSYECAFENLASSTEYQFYVVAYLDKDQQNTESSPKVDKTTLTSYMPLAPEFTVSQGESAQGIRLFIKLPEKVMVQTETKLSPNKKVNEPYPLYFKVSRVIAGSENYEDVCDLYYNGTELTETPVEYEEGGKPYEVGKTVGWFDDYANLIGGVKYEYKIISCSDTNAYDKIVCPEGKENNSTSTLDNKASKAVGWKSALPSFKVKSPVKTLSDNKSEVLSYEFGFDAEWKDLGKAGDYKFAIKQNRRSLGAEDSAGEDTWLDGGKFFETLEELTSHKVKFGSNSGLDEKETGLYAYTLYIVSKDVGKIGEALGVEGKELCHADAIDKVLVTKSVNLPKPEFTVKGGYKDKVVLTVSNLQPNVTYEVTRTTILKDGIPSNDSEKTEKIPLYETGDDVTSTTFTYPDEVQGNCRYSYILKATDKNGGGYSLSESQEAETLGTPDASFNSEALGYDSVTISFDKVLAAESYTVQFGASNSGFGGGATFEITKSGEKWVGSSSGGATAKVDFAADRFTVTIEKPKGYDDATKAGDTAALTVTAKSDKYPAQEEDASAQSKSVPVKVLGPAPLVATVNTFENAEEDSITVSWNKVDGANGYLIRRVMYSDAGMTKVAEDSEVTYYCDASGEVTLVDDDGDLSGRIKLPIYENGKFTLKDISEKADSTTSAYEKAQAKIFWGLPFRYIVLPVLKSNDFSFESNSLKPKRNSIAAYTNFEERQTDGVATLGYGMEVRAEKSKNTGDQTITWVKPYYASKIKPRVFRRLVDGNGPQGNFSLVEGSANLSVETNTFTYTPNGDEKYNAYEYIVQYGVVNTPTLKEDLRKDFENRKDAESPTEQANKGYLFTVEDYNLATCNLAAVQGGSNTYAERVTWDTSMKAWDYKVRALGPTGIKLYVRNNNLDDGWHEVATINGINYSGTVTTPNEVDVSASKGSDGISLYPTGIANGSSGTTNGALKVLRDYKHYYALSLTRGDLETQKYTPGFGDFVKKNTKQEVDEEETEKLKVFAYRQITDEELVRAATLAMSIGFERAWSKNSSDPWSRTKGDRKYTESSPGSGKITYKTSTGVSWNYNPGTTLEYDSLCINLETKSKESLSAFVTISGTIKGDAPSYTAICPPEKYYGTLTVYSPISFYNNASIDFDLKKNSGSIKVTRNGSNTSFGNITPLPFAGSSTSYSFEGHNDSEEWQ